MPRNSIPPVLSRREAQIVRLILLAKPIKEIAFLIGISPGSVTQRLADLYAKLGIHTRAELALWAMYQEIAELRKQEPAA